MKRLSAMILALILIFSLCAEAFADSADTHEPVRLEGQFAEREIIRTRAPGGATTPYYLDKPVVNCRHAKVVLSVEQKGGDCSGNYYLYAMDLDDKWEHIGTFKVDKKRINGNEYSYDFDLDHESSFVAVALWPADKGMYCDGYFKYSVYVDSSCVSEYSDRIPEPIFEPSDVTDEHIAIGFSSDPYSNPWGTAGDAWVGSVYAAGDAWVAAVYNAFYGK